MSDKHFILTDPSTGTTSELPLLGGTLGNNCLDVSALPKNHGVFTHDPGFVSTSSCKSDITFIDGGKGILMFRGYPIEQLAGQSNFIEVCYLLLKGELPDAAELEEFDQHIRTHTMINESLRHFFQGFNYDAHPMAMMTGVVGSMSAFYHEQTDIYDPENREMFARRMIAKIPTVAAAAYKHYLGEPFVYPRNDLDYCSNLLHMLFARPSENYEVNPVFAKALDLLFILHADHEQNASTSTVRLAGSSGANPYAAVAAGVACLWGPAHGGANEAVLNMLNEIGSVDQIPKYVEKAKDKNDPFRLMGFGHRVYKNFDPRATLIRQTCQDVLAELGDADNPLFELAQELEQVALNDDYFKEKKLYPNVDFYSGIIYRAMGIPVNMFTVMFAIARTVGWVAHWQEMIADPKGRIGRPRQIYTGAGTRDYVPLNQR